VDELSSSRRIDSSTVAGAPLIATTAVKTTAVAVAAGAAAETGTRSNSSTSRDNNSKILSQQDIITFHDMP
jgi:uncharacterized protein (UPF0333 family)